MRVRWQVFLALTLLLVSAAKSSLTAGAEDLRIGAVLALTGPEAWIGAAQRDGLLLAAEQINAAGGIRTRPLKIIIADHHGPAESALTGAQKLIEQDQVSALYTNFAHIIAEIQTLLPQHPIPIIYAAAIGQPAKDSPLVFRDYWDVEEHARLLAHSAQRRSFERISYLREESEACLRHERAFLSAANRLGLQILEKSAYSSGAADFKPILLPLTRAAPQALVFCAWRDAALLMRQMDQLRLLRIPTLQTVAPFLPTVDTPNIRRLFAENQSISTWYGPSHDSTDPSQSAFIAAYSRRFRAPPRPDAAFAYDAVFALGAAFAACGGARPPAECVAQELLKTRLQGAAGSLSFDQYGRSLRPGFLIQVQNGTWQRVKED